MRTTAANRPPSIWRLHKTILLSLTHIILDAARLMDLPTLIDRAKRHYLNTPRKRKSQAFNLPQSLS